MEISTTKKGFAFKISSTNFDFNKKEVKISQYIDDVWSIGPASTEWFENMEDHFQTQENSVEILILKEGLKDINMKVTKTLSYKEVFGDEGSYLQKFYEEWLESVSKSEFIKKIFDFSKEFKRCLDDKEHNMHVFYHLLDDVKELEELYNLYNTKESFDFCKKVFDDRKYSPFTKDAFLRNFKEISL